MKNLNNNDLTFLKNNELVFVKEEEKNFHFKIENNEEYDMTLRDCVELAKYLKLEDFRYIFILNEKTNEEFTIKRDGEIIVLDIYNLNTEDEPEIRGYLIVEEDFEEYLN